MANKKKYEKEEQLVVILSLSNLVTKEKTIPKSQKRGKSTVTAMSKQKEKKKKKVMNHSITSENRVNDNTVQNENL